MLFICVFFCFAACVVSVPMCYKLYSFCHKHILNKLQATLAGYRLRQSRLQIINDANASLSGLQ